jgi:hypothetical protein
VTRFIDKWRERFGVEFVCRQVGVPVSTYYERKSWQPSQLGIAPSVGSKGDAYDNAMAEAWVATYKTELIHTLGLTSFERTEHETLAWISSYNNERLHEELGDIPPSEYELLHPEQGEDPDERPSGPPTCKTEISTELNLSATKQSLQPTRGGSRLAHRRPRLSGAGPS